MIDINTDLTLHELSYYPYTQDVWCAETWLWSPQLIVHNAIIE